MGNYTNLLLTESTLVEDLFSVLSIIGGAVVGLIVLYAVYLFFLMGTASDAEKRRKAKSRVIKAFSSIFIIVILMMMLSVIDVTFNNTNGGGSWDGDENAGLSDAVFMKANMADIQVNFIGEKVDESQVEKGKIFNYDSPSGSISLGWQKIETKYTIYDINNFVKFTGDAVGSKVTDFIGVTVVAKKNEEVVASKFWSFTSEGNKITIEYTFYYESMGNDISMGSISGTYIKKPEDVMIIFNLKGEDTEGNEVKGSVSSNLIIGQHVFPGESGFFG